MSPTFDTKHTKAYIGLPGSLYVPNAGMYGSSGCGGMCVGWDAPPLGKKPRYCVHYVVSGIEALMSEDSQWGSSGPWSTTA